MVVAAGWREEVEEHALVTGVEEAVLANPRRDSREDRSGKEGIEGG